MTESTQTQTLPRALLLVVPGGLKWHLRTCVGLTLALFTQWCPSRVSFFREVREKHPIPYPAAVLPGSLLSGNLNVLIRVQGSSSLAECESNLSCLRVFQAAPECSGAMPQQSRVGKPHPRSSNSPHLWGEHLRFDQFYPFGLCLWFRTACCSAWFGDHWSMWDKE